MESKSKLTPRTKKLAIGGGVALILVLALQFLVFKKPSRPASEYIAPVVHHHPATTSKTPNAAAVQAISSYAGQHGVLLLTAGTYGNVLRFLPSLAITDEQLADAVSVLREGLVEATKGN